MKTLKGLYMEEVEIILENMQRNSEIIIKRETGNATSFAVNFEDENFFRKIEDMLYFAQKDYGYEDNRNAKYSVYIEDDED